MPNHPTISVCVVTHDDGPWLDEALDSVRAQGMSDYEVIVVDDASSDDTARRIRRHRRPGLTAVRSQRNAGEARSTNHAMRLARGRYIKLLHGDDRLEPDALERLVEAVEADAGIGLAVSRRRILIPSGDAAAAAWAKRYARLDTRLVPLSARTDGRALLAHFLDCGHLVNGIAEPSGVLIRRSVLEKTGGLHLHMVGHLDVDLLMRAAARGEVAFVDAELYAYRRHADSASSRRLTRELHFLDRAWSLEGMRRLNLDPRLPMLLRREIKQVAQDARRQVALGPATWKLARLQRLAVHLAAGRTGRARALHGHIPPHVRP